MQLNDAVFNFNYDGEDFQIPVSGSTLRGCVWFPKKEPQYAVIFVHDFGSFATQNHDIFDIINENGGVVYCCDHFGHGRSPGPRLGCTIENIENEISELIFYVMQKTPDLPIYLYGQAAGALAIMDFILDRKLNSDIVFGVILESPWIVSWKQRKIGLYETTFYMMMNKIHPNYIFDLQFTKYSTETSPLYIEKSESCPLYFPYMTPKAYISAMKTITNVRSKCDFWPQTLPVLFAFGRDDTVFNADQIIDFTNSLRRVSKNIDVRAYSCGHLLTKGRERAHFLEDAVEFFLSLNKKK